MLPFANLRFHFLTTFVGIDVGWGCAVNRFCCFTNSHPVEEDSKALSQRLLHICCRGTSNRYLNHLSICDPSNVQFSGRSGSSHVRSTNGAKFCSRSIILSKASICRSLHYVVYSLGSEVLFTVLFLEIIRFGDESDAHYVVGHDFCDWKHIIDRFRIAIPILQTPQQLLRTR